MSEAAVPKAPRRARQSSPKAASRPPLSQTPLSRTPPGYVRIIGAVGDEGRVTITAADWRPNPRRG